jgi:hypothetical protein
MYRIKWHRFAQFSNLSLIISSLREFPFFFGMKARLGENRPTKEKKTKSNG